MCAATLGAALLQFESSLAYFAGIRNTHVHIEWAHERPPQRVCARSVLCNTLVEPGTLPPDTLCAHCGCVANAQRSVFAMDMCATIDGTSDATIKYPIIDPEREHVRVEYFLGASCLHCAEAHAAQQATMQANETYLLHADHALQWRDGLHLLRSLHDAPSPPRSVPMPAGGSARHRNSSSASSAPVAKQIRQSLRARAETRQKDYEATYVPFDVMAHILRTTLADYAHTNAPLLLADTDWATFVRKRIAQRPQCRMCWRRLKRTAEAHAVLRVEADGRALGTPVYYCSTECVDADRWLSSHSTSLVLAEETAWLTDQMTARFANLIAHRNASCYCAVCVMGMVLENALRATGAETSVSLDELRRMPSSLFEPERKHCVCDKTARMGGWSPLIVYDGGALVPLEHAAAPVASRN